MSPGSPSLPRVSVIIPHYNGREILLRCLEGLSRDDYPALEIIVVDNASTDGSAAAAKERFPGIRVVSSDRNLGFAGGCNLGMESAAGDYFVLLNNDAVVSSGWLEPLVRRAEEDRTIAALQPKILSISNEGAFDYAGAAGGFMDVFGYPFARGRIFFTLETDEGQYETGSEIFWASGTCTLIRKTAVEKVGYLDETFFAHMEEIDLDWRFHLAGFNVRYVPESVVRHDAGTTLAPGSSRKIYLNHRNGLIMLLKNYSAGRLAWVLPIRFCLEFVAATYFLLKGDAVQTKAILSAMGGVLSEMKYIREARRRTQSVRVVSDRDVDGRMYRGSIVWQYFVLGRKTFRRIFRG